MSRAWLEAAAHIADLQIVGLIDVDADRAHTRAREFGLHDSHIGTDLGAALSATNATAVFDVTPPQARLDIVKTALVHGCHVLTEKPMAANLDDARAIIKLAGERNRIHAVVQNRRYLANVRRIRRFVDTGRLGKTTSIHCDFFIAPHFGGFREEMDHVLLVDMAIHTFDAARFMADAEARTVFCKEWEPAGSWYKSGSSALAVFELSNDIVFTYRGSWSAMGQKTSWESQWRIVCERGCLVWDGFDRIVAEVATGKRDGLFDVMAEVDVPPLDPRDRTGGHLGVMQDFQEAISTGRQPETRGSDNIKSLAMVFGAVESSQNQQLVRLAV
jgi:predicted dehydrogenase